MSNVLPVRETAKILADILTERMALEEGSIVLYNQKRRLKPKSGLMLDIAILGQQTYGNSSKMVDVPGELDLVEVQTISAQEVYQIDIFSANDSARLRRNEPILALSSVYAQQLSERHALKISRLPQSAVDVSGVEASARLNRYAITVTVLRSYSVASSVPTFDAFQNPPRSILVNP